MFTSDSSKPFTTQSFKSKVLFTAVLSTTIPLVVTGFLSAAFLAQSWRSHAANERKVLTEALDRAGVAESRRSEIVAEVKANGSLESAIYLIIGLSVPLSAGLSVAAALMLSDRISKYLRTKLTSIVSASAQIADTVKDDQFHRQPPVSTGMLEQFALTALQTVSRVESSSMNAQSALSLSRESYQSLLHSLVEIETLQQKVSEIANNTNSLKEQTRQISAVAEQVSELAQQTNMLALKASVEASHAGEEGKGFSVVAGEIRKLAERSKKSAQKINLLAADIKTAIDSTIVSTENGQRTLRDNISLAENTSQKLIEVSNAIDTIVLDTQKVSLGLQQQEYTIQQLLEKIQVEKSQDPDFNSVRSDSVKSSTQALGQMTKELQATLN
jgi:methyl-accepting chemotaxis protein